MKRLLVASLLTLLLPGSPAFAAENPSFGLQRPAQVFDLAGNVKDGWFEASTRLGTIAFSVSNIWTSNEEGSKYVLSNGRVASLSAFTNYSAPLQTLAALQSIDAASVIGDSLLKLAPNFAPYCVVKRGSGQPDHSSMKHLVGFIYKDASDGTMIGVIQPTDSAKATSHGVQCFVPAGLMPKNPNDLPKLISKITGGVISISDFCTGALMDCNSKLWSKQ